MDFNTAAPPQTMNYRSQPQHDSPRNGTTVADENEKPVFFFDIDNCLYPKSLDIHRMMGQLIDQFFQNHLSLSQEEANELHYRYYREYGLAIEGLVRHHKVDALEYNSKVDDALPLEDVIKPSPELRKLIEDIDTSKVRLWLFTNAYITHGKRVVKLLQIDDLFEGITYCDYGSDKFYCKPHVEMFEKAMAEAGIKSNERCYFVDDSYINCKAAEGRGWKTAHLLDENDPAPAEPASKYQIRSLQELRKIFPEVFKSSLGMYTVARRTRPLNAVDATHRAQPPSTPSLPSLTSQAKPKIPSPPPMSPQKQYQTMSPTPTDTPPAPQSSALPPSHPFNPDANIKPPRTPLLRLELRDLSTPGAQAFLRLTHASHALTHAVDTVLRLLYTHTPPSSIPGTRSITLVLRELDGVAYTTGLALDDDHKEIHLSTSYIAHVPEARQKEEILGVLVHEMVHCWQHSACGSAPTGLTEGVADWVRLKAGLKPPHWRRHGDCEWDAGGWRRSMARMS
ncbi:pyrimidine 5-nucleotidase [Stemphylium lycopersici]|nr:pyrimidine 5-nucleotidase [Stemphylium lycopersici]